MKQLLILLQSRCEYCGHFRLHPLEVNRYICKFRLINHGLLEESQTLEDIKPKNYSRSKGMTNGIVAEDDDEDNEEEETDDLKRRRLEFVSRALRRTKKEVKESMVPLEKVEAIAEERRNLVKDFLAAIKKSGSCGSCGGSVHKAPCYYIDH